MKSVYYFIGILIGVVLAFVIFKLANRNHKIKTQYDERQKEVRGKGYQYGYYTMMIYEAVMLILSVGEISLPVENYVLHFAGILIGGLVLSTYCIWHNAYWGLNNDRRRYGIIFLLFGIINAIPVVGSLLHGEMMENGKLATPAINLGVLILLVVIGTELLIKDALDRKEAEE